MACKIFSTLLMLIVSGSAIPQDAEKVFKKASSSVFTIETPSSVGTGFVVAPDIFVTCYHVVKGAGADITIKQASGVTLDYITHNEEADIAIFRLSRKFQSHLTLGESAAIGSPVYVIGSPLGALDRSITSGIVSQRWASGTGHELIQISAAISPGSSGSPVLNKSGLVVGMAQSSIEKGQSNNFALGVREIKKLLPKGNSNNRSRKFESTTISSNHLLTIKAHHGPIYSVKYSPDGTTLASTGSERELEIQLGDKTKWEDTITLWDAKSGELINKLKTKGISSYLDFSSTSPLIACGVAHDDETPINSFKELVDSKPNFFIEVWDWKTGDLKFIVPTLKEEIKHVQFTKDGTKLVSASASFDSSVYESTVRIWDVQSQELLWQQSTNPIEALLCFALLPDEDKFAVGSVDGYIACYEFRDVGRNEDLVESPSDQSDKMIRSVAFSPDGLMLANCSGTIIYLRNTRDARFEGEIFLGRQPKLSLKGHSSTVTEIQFSPNGKYLASASQDKTIRLWDAKSGKLISTFYGHRGSVFSVAWSPDGTKLASADSDGTIMIWKVK